MHYSAGKRMDGYGENFIRVKTSPTSLSHLFTCHTMLFTIIGGLAGNMPLYLV